MSVSAQSAPDRIVLSVPPISRFFLWQQLAHDMMQASSSLVPLSRV
jgi:hypothetical protein